MVKRSISTGKNAYKRCHDIGTTYCSKRSLTMNPLNNTQAKNTHVLKIRPEFTVNAKQHFPHKTHRLSKSGG